MVAWNLQNSQLRADPLDNDCPHSDHGNHNNGNVDEALNGMANEWLTIEEAKTPNPFMAILWGAFEATAPKIYNPQPVDLGDFGANFAQEVAEGFLDLAKDPSKEWFQNLLDEHPRAVGTATLALASGLLVAGNGYIQSESSEVQVKIPLSLLGSSLTRYEWECGNGILEVELSGSIQLSFSENLFNVDVSEWGLKLMLRYRY